MDYEKIESIWKNKLAGTDILEIIKLESIVLKVHFPQYIISAR